MTPEQLRLVQTAFLELSALGPEQAGARIRDACHADPEVEREVRRLLRHHDADERFLQRPLLGEQFSVESFLESGGAQPGRRFGQYRIVRLIGRGGQGAVFEAEQENPRRRVALKVISSAGLAEDADSLVERFERESGALARLKHPGIAQVYESGVAVAPDGSRQPFFAMELIAGAPLLRHADAKGLSASARLQLLAPIAEAVHAAHQQGIIHRDLKPDNILVDEEGRPRIVDFGVARIIGDESAQRLRTLTGQLVGTLRYMSPEQAAGETDEIDTRTDIYALGVIGYELLAGRPPYDVVERALHEAVRVIREEAPAPLSSVDRAYRGDVETIIGKALHKEKSRRYGSAQELADDIGRFLRNEPITARAPTAAYYVGKLARRYPRTMFAAGAALAAILVLAVVAQVQAVRARTNLARAHFGLAELARMTGEWETVLSESQLALDAGHADRDHIRFQRVQALDALGRLDAAAAELDRIEHAGDAGQGAAARIALWRGDLALRRATTEQEVGAARSTIQAAIAAGLAPGEAAFAGALLAPDWREAGELARAAFSHDRYDARFLELASACAFMNGSYDEAAETARMLQVLHPHAAQPIYLEAVAMALPARADVSRAIARLKDAPRNKGVDDFVQWAERLQRPPDPDESAHFIDQVMPFEAGSFAGVIKELLRPTGSANLAIRTPACSWRLTRDAQAQAIDIAVGSDDPDARAKLEELHRTVGAPVASILEFMYALGIITYGDVFGSKTAIADAEAALIRAQRANSFVRYQQFMDEALAMIQAVRLRVHNEPDAADRLKATVRQVSTNRAWVAHGPYSMLMVKAARRCRAFDVARDLQSRFEAEYPDRPDVWMSRVELEQDAGAFADVVKAAARALELDPKHEAARAALTGAVPQVVSIKVGDEIVPVADYLKARGISLP